MRIIETDRLYLRPLNINDAKRIEELAGDYDVAKTTLTVPHPYPKGAAKSFIDSVLEAEQSGRLVIFSLIEKDLKQLIGIINLNIHPAFKRGELAYWVGKDYWGMGYGTEAAKSLLQLGFDELGLNKIFAQAFTTNPGSYKIMEKIGLRYEGTLKQHVCRFGEFYDLVQYGLIKEEYFKGCNPNIK